MITIVQSVVPLGDVCIGHGSNQLEMIHVLIGNSFSMGNYKMSRCLTLPRRCNSEPTSFTATDKRADSFGVARIGCQRAKGITER